MLKFLLSVWKVFLDLCRKLCFDFSSVSTPVSNPFFHFSDSWYRGEHKYSRWIYRTGEEVRGMVEALSGSRNSECDCADVHSAFGPLESPDAGSLRAWRAVESPRSLKRYLSMSGRCHSTSHWDFMLSWKCKWFSLYYQNIQEASMVLGMIDLECQFHWTRLSLADEQSTRLRGLSGHLLED